MASLRVFYRRLLSLWHSNQLHDDIAAEMSFHIEECTAQNIRNGMAPEQARREAAQRFGSVQQLREEGYELRGVPALESLVQDLKFGVRLLYRTPGFSLLALACLTVGIGANAAVWSWVEGILLRPYPAVAHQDRMMAIAGTVNGVPGTVGNTELVSWPDFQDFRTNTRLFDGFIVSRVTSTTLSVGDHAEVALGSIVTSNYFPALAIVPILGRGFEPAEDQGRNAHPVTVISYDLWQKRFGGDRSIVGRTQRLNGQMHTIIGVAPPGFYGTFVGRSIDFWVPVSMQERFDSSGYHLEDRDARWVESYAILKPGVSAQQAQQDISSVASRLEASYPVTNRGRGVKLYPLWQTPFNQAGNLLPTLSIASAVVALLLVIVCANISNLLLVRGFARRHEIAIRLAVGARRGRLFRQLVTEGFVLCVLGAAAGVTAANWARNFLVVLLPGGSRLNLPGAIDWRVAAMSVGVGICAAMFFGLVPALQSNRVEIVETLKADGNSVVGKRQGGIIRSGLVVAQVALSFALLVGAGLLIASLRQMQNNTSGFDDPHLLTASINFDVEGSTPARVASSEDQIVDRLEALPGVESAAFARITPFEYRSYSSDPVAIDGSKLLPDMLPRIDYNEVGPHYLATMGIPLVSGREFTRADNETSEPVAILNEVMAAQLWPKQDAVGRRIQVKGRWRQVVGVARTVKYRDLTESPRPFFYVPLRQVQTAGLLQIRTAMPPNVIGESLTREIHRIDPNLTATSVRTMHAQIEWTTAPQQAAFRLITVFAGMALILAAVGLYGVMSYTVAQSTRELGLRVALGAAPSDLLRLVMLRGIKLTLPGVLVGIGIALASSRLLGYLLYHVNPRDPSIFALAFVLMSVSALAASFLPAWRASRANPLSVLRT